MAERRERGFTLLGVPYQSENGWIVQLILSGERKEEQEEWLKKREGKKIRLAREEVRHPED